MSKTLNEKFENFTVTTYLNSAVSGNFTPLEKPTTDSEIWHF